MRKAFILSVTVFAVVLFAGCGKQEQQGLQTENAPAATQKTNMGKVISNIHDAMSSGEKMKCTYTVANEESEEGESNVLTAEAYLDGEKYKSVSDVEGQGKIYTVFDGNNVYTWTEQSKQGMKIGKDCYSEVQTDKNEDEAEDLPEEKMPEDIFNSAFNVQCEKAGSIDWSLPQGIEFVDQCEMIKAQTEQLQKMQQGMPEGFQLPEGIEMPEGVEMP